MKREPPCQILSLSSYGLHAVCITHKFAEYSHQNLQRRIFRETFGSKFCSAMYIICQQLHKSPLEFHCLRTAPCIYATLSSNTLLQEPVQSQITQWCPALGLTPWRRPAITNFSCIIELLLTSV